MAKYIFVVGGVMSGIGKGIATASIGRILKSKGFSVGPGSMVRFVVTEGKGRIRDKVKLEEDTKQEEYDADYYISHQIIPGVEKIFSVLGYSEDELKSEDSQSTLGSF